MDLESFLPTSEQLEKSERIMIAHGGGPAGGGGGGVGGGGGSGNNTPDRVSGTSDPPFKLRPLGPKQKSRSSWKTRKLRKKSSFVRTFLHVHCMYL